MSRGTGDDDRPRDHCRPRTVGEDAEVEESRRMASSMTVPRPRPQPPDGFVPVTSRKCRKLREALRGRSVLERWLIAGLGLLGLVCFALALNSGFRNGVLDSRTTCQSGECLISATTITQSMDAAVDPCDNFFGFACGNWQNHYVSASGRSNSWFAERTRYNAMAVTRILGEIDRKNDLKSVKQARRLYRTCLDTDALDEVGYGPVYRTLDRLGLPRGFPDFATAAYPNGTTFNVARTLALAQRHLSADILVQLSVEPDPAGRTVALHLSPPVAGFPSPLPDYPASSGRGHGGAEQTARVALLLKVRYMVSVIRELARDDDGAAVNVTSLAVLALKILIMESQLKEDDPEEERRTPREFTFRGLQDYMSSNSSGFEDENTFDWQSYVDALVEGTNGTLTMDHAVYVRNPEYFLGLQSRLYTTAPEEFQRFIWWKTVEILIPHTTTEMRRLRTSFVESVIPSLRKPTRTDVCTDVTKAFLNLPVAYEFYVRDDLRVTAVKVRKMLSQLQQAFKGMISDSDWTDRVTKRATSEKVDAITAEIGYPKIFETPDELDKLYEHMEFREDEYLQSMLDVKAFEVTAVLRELGKPINTNRTPSTLTDPLEVNAFYSRVHNSITIPAGILQMPFFYKGVDVVNYGAIGSILGHEMTHGFDVEGKNYDVHGKRTAWWSRETVDEYLRRARCFVDEYDRYALTDGVRLNGTRTLAENMADNIGLRQSWLAYKIFQNENDPRLPGLKGYSDDQLFFLAYANVWCQKPDDKSDKLLRANDEHSPNDVRVIGSLRNSREFADVWKCPVDSPMNPRRKCFIW